MTTETFSSLKGQASPLHIVRLRPATSDHLNMIRGIAALAVLFGHVRGLYFQDFPNVKMAGVVTKMIYVVTGFGHEAVMVFFVLSGFFIAGSALSMSVRWSWTRYLGNRLIRLHLVLIPALLLTALVDQIAMRMPNGSAYYYNAIPHFNAQPFVERISAPVFLGNALFLQTIAVPVFGSDSPLWSLANEFWYYILFPLILVCFLRGRVALKVVYIGLLIILIALLPFGLLPGFAIWLLGAAMHFVPKPRIRPRFIVLLARVAFTGVFAGALMLVRLGRVPERWSDPLVGFSFALWMYCLLLPTERSLTTLTYSRTASLLSSCSYSVYAIHLPLVILLRTIVPAGVWRPTPINLFAGLLIGLGAFGIGYGFSRVTESKTNAVREKVFVWMGVSAR